MPSAVITRRHPIIIAAYTPEWPSRFATERARLLPLFPEPEFRIEHVGSTAVPGLGAKPIVDMLLGAPRLQDIEARIARLDELRYEYVAEHEKVLPQRRFFAYPAVQPRRFHLHAVVLGATLWRAQLAFRDALRSNRQLALEYESLKRRLAAECGDDRERYTDAKAEFVAAVVREQAGL